MIFITQCQCPHEHCLIAFAWEGEQSEQEKAERSLKEQLGQLTAAGVLNPWCGLCKSRDFHYRTHRTIWKTLEEATPHLYEAERRQLETAAILGPINEAARKGSN